MARRTKLDTTARESLPYYETPEFKPTVQSPFPEWAIVREVDFQIRGTELRFFFSNGSKNIKVPNQAAFKKLIDDIVEGAFTKWVDKECSPGAPYSSPMSLKNRRWTYVVYVLSNKSWQFARHGRPITVGRKSLARPPAHYYWHAHRVAQGFDDADMGTPFEDENAAPKDNCKVAFFLADGTNAGAIYEHPINLHVDLVYGGTKPRFMPIMIDPDVRYPGGSGLDDDGGKAGKAK